MLFYVGYLRYDKPPTGTGIIAVLDRVIYYVPSYKLYITIYMYM